MSAVPKRFPKSQMPDFTDWPQISANSFLALGDAEIPYHDSKIFDMVFAMGQHFEIDDLIIGGDFIAFDSLSKWAWDMAVQPKFEDERAEMIECLMTFQEGFKRITYITGNHERRLPHLFEGHDTISSYVEAKIGIQVSPYAKCIVNSCGRDIMICHQDNYSKIPLSVPYEIASNELMHVICFHTHRLCQGWDRSNTFQIAEAGYARDPKKTAYKQLRVTRHPKWNPGFMLVQNGVFQIVHPGNFELIMDSGVANQVIEKYPAEVIKMAQRILELKGEAA